MGMEARHLRYALALADHEHFGRAAASLGIAQPPLSTQIAALEREVGERLFDRTSRGVFPTAPGHAFLARARAALVEMDLAAIDAGRAARGETGRLRIGFIGSALLDPLPGVIGQFRKTHPDVRLSMQEMESNPASAAVVSGDLDVAVGRGGPRGSGAENLVTVPIGADHLVAVLSVAHPFAGRPSIKLDQLSNEPLVVSPDAADSYLRPLFGGERTALEGATMARDVHTIAGLAACRAGVGLGPSRMRLVARKDISFCDVRPRFMLPDLQMSFRVADDSPVIAAFLSVVRRNCVEVGSRLDQLLASHPAAATEREPELGAKRAAGSM